MGFIADTRRSLTGPTQEVQSVKKADGSSYHFAPKKLPQSVADEINALQTRVLVAPGAVKKIKQLAAVYKKNGSSDATEDAQKAIEALSDEDTESMVSLMQAMPSETTAKIQRLALENGTGLHDFTDEKGEVVGEGRMLTPQILNEVLAYGPLASELTKIVMDYSGPLTRKSSRSS